MSGGIDHTSDIVFVGGGPVGLWTAIQAKLLTGKNVTVIEKYLQYQRSQYVHIDAHSLRGVPSCDSLNKLVKKWGNRTVSICDIEDDLIKVANEVGVKIIRGYKADPQTLPTQFPKAKVFVGADGAKSVVREQIFKDEFRFSTNLQYMAQVQYVIKAGDTIAGKSLKDLSEHYRMQKFAKHLIVQNTRPLESGDSQVTLQIFIDKETYDGMKDASFKNPYYFELHLDKIPAKLQSVLKKWWGARSLFHQEDIKKNGDNKMTVVALDSYAAKQLVSTDKEGRVWALVGDAAAAFPFFRAINTGFLMGTQLASSISKANFNSYSRYATFRLYWERLKAFFKSLFLDLSKLFLIASDRVFWQVNKIKAGQREQIMCEGQRIWSAISA